MIRKKINDAGKVLLFPFKAFGFIVFAFKVVIFTFLVLDSLFEWIVSTILK
ncbi:hypothetical protein [Desulfamplus magnetovallimortis]|nr:hypothetical protein [Desulfamplus magnetovallimortis]